MLLREAEKRGLPTVSGIDLLLYQAARAFKMFTGKDVDMPPCSRRWRANWTEVDTRPARLYNTRRLFTFSLRYFL